MGCLYNQNMQRHAPCYILKLSVHNFLSYIISKIWGTEQPDWRLRESLSHKWISSHLLLHRQHLESWWRYTIMKAENRNPASNLTSRNKPSEIRMRETTVLHMHIGSHAQRGTQFVTDEHIEACSSRKLLPMHVTSLTNCHTGIGLRWTYCIGSFVIGTLPAQLVIFDDLSLRKVIGVPILLCVSVFWISVTKLWDKIIRLCMCNGHTAHPKALDSRLSRLTMDQPDIVLPLTDKWEHASWIGNEIY